MQTTRVLLKDVVAGAAVPLTGAAADYDALLEMVGDSRFVLLGEASHGTHEFYKERAQITKRLITEKNFTAVAVEADWPDAYRVNRYVCGGTEDEDAVDALAGFKRFPAWMWRNADVLDFVGWLRAHNDDLSDGLRKVGFFGLDLYSLHASIQAVLTYLDKVDPIGASAARNRYSCFENFGEDPQAYGYNAGFGLTHSCEEEVVSQLVELHRRAAE
ncbi:MAG TPA: erythromycin esterase family protein, partial [Blastocatellia bacterium]|nr:erythromycin esterase family protein [Blastocatellia bacterium]